MAQQSTSTNPPASTNPGLLPVFGLIGGSLATLGFGAGFGASSYRRSVAFKELVEKFPEPPTAEAEALARGGAMRALLYGTGLAGLMGVGAIAVARVNGICSVQDFSDEIRRWLPTREGLESSVAPRLEPLQRTLTEHMQKARNASDERFKKSELGRSLSRRATVSSVDHPTTDGEKELLKAIKQLDETPAPTK